MQLDKKYLKKFSENTTVIKSVNLTEKNSIKLKKLNIRFSRLLNDFLLDSNKKSLEKFGRNIQHDLDFTNRVVTSVTIDKINLEKLENVNMTLLVNILIDSI